MMAFGDGPLGMIRSDEVMKAEPQDGISILIKRGSEQSSLSLSLSLSLSATRGHRETGPSLARNPVSPGTDSTSTLNSLQDCENKRLWCFVRAARANQDGQTALDSNNG